MRSKYDPSSKLKDWALAIKTFPSCLPPQNIDEPQLRDVKSLELADPKFYIGHRTINIHTLVRCVC